MPENYPAGQLLSKADKCFGVGIVNWSILLYNCIENMRWSENWENSGIYKYMNECLCTVSAQCIRCWKEGDISDSCFSGNTSSKTGTTHFLSVQCRFLHNFAASRNVLSHGFFPTGWTTRSLRTPWPWWRCPTLRTPRCPSTGRPSFSETSGQSKKRCRQKKIRKSTVN